MKAIEQLDRYLEDLNADRAYKPAISQSEMAALWRTARQLKVAARGAQITPDAVFADALEQELLKRQAARHSPTLSWRARARVKVQSWRIAPLWQRSAAIVLTLLLAIGLTVTMLGPQRVLADLQRLLSYVPGFGFVNLEQTRLLPAPIEVRREGVTLRVDQVLAGPDRTVVILNSEGLPPEEHSELAGSRTRPDFQAWLRLPDGRTLVPSGWRLRWGAGTLELPALPEDIYHVTLEITRLPLVPDGLAPGDWAIPLALQPATGPLVAALFPEPYAPNQAEDTYHAVTLRVMEVAQGPEETAVRLQVQWPEGGGQWPILLGQSSPALYDDLGHVYWEAPSTGSASSVSVQAKSISKVVKVAQVEVVRISPDSAPTTAPASAGMSVDEKVLTFAPLSLSAQQLTLSVDAVRMDLPAAARFSVDLGSDPHMGDMWPLDVRLDVAGFPVQITAARLVTETTPWRDGPQSRRLLEFKVADVPELEGRSLDNLSLTASDPRFNGSLGGHSRAAGIRVALELAGGASLPRGMIQVEVDRASVYFYGPWQMTWSIPQATVAEAQAIAPVALRPQGASQTRAGLTLGVEEAMLTDRVTAVTVGLQNPPAGVRLVRLLGSATTAEKERIWLEGDWGKSYPADGFGISWRAPKDAAQGIASDATALAQERGRLLLGPVDPLARQVTLHIPAIEVLHPAILPLEIEVPADLTLPVGFASAFSSPATSDGPTWDVDIPVEIAGYTWRFTRASLWHVNGRTRLVLEPLLSQTAQRAPWPTGFYLTSVTGPDGQAVEPGIGALGAAPPCEPTIAFTVDDPDTGQLLPGLYHIEIEGIAVGIPGPWSLRWELRRP